MTAPLEAEGFLKVERPAQGVGAWLASRIQLPPIGDAVPTRLRLTQEGEGLRWERTFGEMRAVSHQGERGGRIVESAGPFLLEMRLEREGDRVRHRQVGLRLFGVPIPLLFGPRVSGVVGPGPTERSWTVEVEIGHALFGTICRYEGAMHAR